jgi:cobalt-zinc-cadmium efflux system membrane fusion protein
MSAEVETTSGKSAARPSARFARLSKQGAPLLVFGIIVAIGCWGHVTHWKPFSRQRAGVGEGVSSVASSAGSSADSLSVERTTGSAEVIRFESPAAVEKAAIQVSAAVERAMDEYVECNGTVDYDWTRVAELTSRVPGIVWRIEKHLGQWVQGGDVLAIIEAPDVGTAKAALLQAIGQVELKEKVLARLDPMVVAKKQIQEAEAELRAARIALFNAQQQLINLGLSLRVEPMFAMSDEERVRFIRFLGLPEPILETLDKEFTTANLIPLVAPFEAVVIGHEIALGEAVSADKPCMKLADVRHMWIVLDVRQEDSLRLSLGQEVSFTPDGSPISVHSRVSWISTEADARTRTVSARAVVENPIVETSQSSAQPQRLLKANSFGKGRIRVASIPQVVSVPNQAVQWDRSRYIVFVQTSGTDFEVRPVQVGAVGEERTEILAGLSADERVVTIGSHVLKAQLQKVREHSRS